MLVLRSGAVVLWTVCWALVVARFASAGIACLSNPCLHGICIDDVNSTYSCYCLDGYTGVQCQTNWDECWSDPCQNGGTCIDGIAAYNCSCPDGFIGDNCETNYNECESNPCQNNGTCIDLTNGYVCSCVPGFAGDHCELDVAVCNSSEERCQNGGQCIEGPGFKFYCRCASGWAGPRCEDQVDECQSNPCQNNGLCIDVHSDYMCACAYGFTGKSCEITIEFCDEDTCSNDALCVVEDGARVCYCVPDYHGDRCELQYDECLLGTRCLNGGTCIDGVDNFTCSCPPSLTGSLCDCLILDDGSYDCDYVSPTPSSDIISTAITTFDGFTTTEFVTYSIGYNDTTLPSSSYLNDTLVTTGTTIFGIITTTEIAETVTNQSETVTDIVTDSDTTVKYNTEVTVSGRTIDSDNSKFETTTQCGDSCSKSTDFTPKITLEETTPTLVAETGQTIKGIEKEIDSTTSVTVSTITEENSTETVTPQVTLFDLTSTPKMDSTTETMFTDSPVELPINDTTSPTTTTEAMDVTLAFDNGTTMSGSTTLQSECTESACNNQGTCYNTPNGIKCNCNFKYQGKFCNEKISIKSAAFGGKSFITHSVRNTTSIAIEFNAKTLMTNGQIMHVNIANGVYMQLFINSGLLKFKFSCGYQTMLLSELKTYVNKGYPMKIETRLDLYIKEQHCNATLRLNDTVAMSGGQVANITTLDYNTTIYLGSNLGDKDPAFKTFIGCIKDLMINNEERDIFGDAIDAGEVSECSSLLCLSEPCYNGGTCSEHGDGFICSCPNGWMGDYCNRSVCENNPCGGGSCVPHPGSGFLCLCPYGKHGIFCEYNVEITRPSLAPITSGVSSYLVYPLSPSAVSSDRFDLRLRFQTPDMDQIALLAFVGQNGQHNSRSQHMALTFVKGYIMLTWNMGNGARRIFTSRALSPRRGGHAVRVWRRGRTAGISVDARLNATGNANGNANANTLTFMPYLYIGGHPSEHFHVLPHDLPLHSGWRGCIWEVGGQSVGTGVGSGRGVGQCGVTQCTSKSCNAPRGVCIHSPATYGCICNEGWFGPTCSSKKSPCDSGMTQCRGSCVLTADEPQCDCPYGKTGLHCDEDLIPTDVLFTGTRSYAALQPRTLTSVSVAFEAEIKPYKERGLILHAQTPHFYTSLSIQGGLLEYRWVDVASGLTSVVRSGVVVSLRAWHGVRAGRRAARLYVWTDAALAVADMRAHAYPHTTHNATILIGGAKDLASLPFDTMSGPPEPFMGCIRNVHVNNVLIPLEANNIKEGQNLADCDGTACGVETCGGGTCVLEGGRPQCACSTGAGGGSGARCRRDVHCRTHAQCSYPHGHCRQGACVCAAGFGGHKCLRKINITVPEFNGEALLSLNRRNLLGRHVEEQKLNPNRGRPSYLAINFTTAEPSGLLVWIIMDLDYLGIGLENGYLKIVWSFQQDNSTIEVFSKESNYPIRHMSRLIPQAGYLADAEWHTLLLRIDEQNITMTIDDMLAFMEEPGLGTNRDYIDVDVFIGGITEEESVSAKKIFPNNFKGCIDHISTRENVYTTNYTQMYSENLKSCQLFP